MQLNDNVREAGTFYQPRLCPPADDLYPLCTAARGRDRGRGDGSIGIVKKKCYGHLALQVRKRWGGKVAALVRPSWILSLATPGSNRVPAVLSLAKGDRYTDRCTAVLSAVYR